MLRFLFAATAATAASPFAESALNPRTRTGTGIGAFRHTRGETIARKPPPLCQAPPPEPESYCLQ